MIDKEELKNEIYLAINRPLYVECNHCGAPKGRSCYDLPYGMTHKGRTVDRVMEIFNEYRELATESIELTGGI